NATALAFRYSDPIKYAGPALMEVYQDATKNAKPSIPVSDFDKQQKSVPADVSIVEKKLAPETTGLALELRKRREENAGLVALVPLPKNGTRQVTVLLAPVSDGTFTAHVIDDDPSKLSFGKLRVHNLSPHP